MSEQAPPGLLLPERTNLIHIGPQKTGSTFIQAAFHQKRDRLAEYGVMYPGPGMKQRNAMSAGLGFASARGAPPARKAAWGRLLRQLDAAAELRVCISHEGFGRASAARAQAVVRELGGERPHVLAVARPYDRYLPSQWQQRLKSGERRPYEAWLEIVLDSQHVKDPAWRNVWSAHDTVALVDRWADVVGLDNVTIVAGDERDRDFLPGVFEQLLGLPQGFLASAKALSNRSLSLPEAELLRRTTGAIASQGGGTADYYDLVYRGLTRHLVNLPFPADEPRIPVLPGWAAERVAELSAARVAGLRESGVRVIGDLELLQFRPGPTPFESAGTVAQVSIETASRVIEGLVGASVAARSRAEVKHRRQVDRLRAAPKPVPPVPPASFSRRLARRLRRRLTG